MALYLNGNKLQYGADGHNYSTQEQAVGTWIDGSTIYEKTIDFGALPNNDKKSVNHNISNLAHIVSCECIAENPSAGYRLPIPFSHRNTLHNQIQMEITDTTIDIYTVTDRSSYSWCYVTIRYTKSST